MKKIIQRMLCIIVVFACFPLTVFATAGTTDIYIGITTISKSNVRFLVVDETDQSIDEASIEIWTNEALGYQLLGVSRDGGIYETTIPYGDYPYKVYKDGYETVEQELHLPNKKNPHIEKVVLKKIKPTDPGQKEPNVKPGDTPGNWYNRIVKTGDETRIIFYVVLVCTSVIIMFLLYKRKRRYQ